MLRISYSSLIGKENFKVNPNDPWYISIPRVLKYRNATRGNKKESGHFFLSLF